MCEHCVCKTRERETQHDAHTVLYELVGSYIWQRTYPTNTAKHTGTEGTFFYVGSVSDTRLGHTHTLCNGTYTRSDAKMSR